MNNENIGAAWCERLHCMEQIKEADYTIFKIDEEIKLYNAKIAYLLGMRSELEDSIHGTMTYIKSLANEIIVK